ncbi:hypothetical protein L596_011041 [Steinernema carpocapsae]|uniref:Protein sleepless n=1 Tax=Steinernema carpocapsae TaxID=34508 RepID=A0A4U5NRT0_STECR|nr:hypothetical protein L596_011041 [Steinernema carpocapsae]
MAPRWKCAVPAAAQTTVLILAIMAFQEVEGIGCFVCSSFNGSNPLCEDSFNSTIDQTTKSSASGIANYQFPCWSFKKNREGLFPADHCIKVNGYRTDDSRHTMVIRTCALDSGTLTADTEIVRISHCGHFKYNGNQYTGCVQSCSTDGCNSTPRPAASLLLLPVALGLLQKVLSALYRL